MDIIISSLSDKPIYLQIFEQISSQIISGKLKANEKLPSIRQIASELNVSIISVKGAWDMLDAKGLISTGADKGTFVAEMNNEQLEQTKISEARKLIEKDIKAIISMGLNKNQIIELINEIAE